jgi:hypothetical protein
MIRISEPIRSSSAMAPMMIAAARPSSPPVSRFQPQRDLESIFLRDVVVSTRSPRIEDHLVAQFLKDVH